LSASKENNIFSDVAYLFGDAKKQGDWNGAGCHTNYR
jgi:hypothetical protein